MLWGNTSLRWSGICSPSSAQHQQSVVEATGKVTTECQPAPWHATGLGDALASVSAVQQRPREVRTCLQLAPGVLWFCQQNRKGIVS